MPPSSRQPRRASVGRDRCLLPLQGFESVGTHGGDLAELVSEGFDPENASLELRGWKQDVCHVAELNADELLFPLHEGRTRRLLFQPCLEVAIRLHGICCRREELFVGDAVAEIEDGIAKGAALACYELDTPAAVVDDGVAVAAQRAGKIRQLRFAAFARDLHRNP